MGGLPLEDYRGRRFEESLGKEAKDRKKIFTWVNAPKLKKIIFDTAAEV